MPAKDVESSAHAHTGDETAAEVAASPLATSSFTAGAIPPVLASHGSSLRSISDEAFGDSERQQQWEQTPVNERLERPPLPAAMRAMMKHDVIYERLAHGLAYKDQLAPEDQAFLAEHGLAFGSVIHGVGGLDMTTFVPASGSSAAPVLAFRGTAGLADLIDDAHPAGVGSFQMAANEGLIASTLAALASHGGSPVVIGHSLGGALAQMTAARFADRVGSVVTFQSPGIPKHMAEQVEAHDQAAGANSIESHHYVAVGDPIAAAGEAFTPGFMTVIHRGFDVMQDTANTSPLTDHHALPLTEFVTSGEGLGKPRPRSQAYTGRSPATATSSADVNAWSATGGHLHHFLEAMRHGLSGVVEAAERMGHLGAAPREAYVEVWEQVRGAIDQHAAPATIIGLISSSRVRDADKQLMIENLQAIEASE